MSMAPLDGERPEEHERWVTLSELEQSLQQPMLVLSFIWLALVLIELLWTSGGVFELLGTIIWVIFVLEFALRFTLAPRKVAFLKRNPITIVALIAPAFRFLSALRFLRFARGLRLIRVVGTANRGLNALGRSFSRRGMAYVLSATALVIALGAGGMVAFEPSKAVGGGFTNYGDALWWTAMLISTMGSGYWPVTAEGRVLALLMSLYGLAVFSYITASLATFFIGQEAKSPEGAVAGLPELEGIRRELALLRAELQQR